MSLETNDGRGSLKSNFYANFDYLEKARYLMNKKQFEIISIELSKAASREYGRNPLSYAKTRRLEIAQQEYREAVDRREYHAATFEELIKEHDAYIITKVGVLGRIKEQERQLSEFSEVEHLKGETVGIYR